MLDAAMAVTDYFEKSQLKKHGVFSYDGNSERRSMSYGGAGTALLPSVSWRWCRNEMRGSRCV